ncbi:hypothetical protein F4604DRAFT_1689499 [Suillus subluteus]|nr:hypothetical protein F4604DRAFT_1689499 [Suillus subluteus]
MPFAMQRILFDLNYLHDKWGAFRVTVRITHELKVSVFAMEWESTCRKVLRVESGQSSIEMELKLESEKGRSKRNELGSGIKDSTGARCTSESGKVTLIMGMTRSSSASSMFSVSGVSEVEVGTEGRLLVGKSGVLGSDEIIAFGTAAFATNWTFNVGPGVVGAANVLDTSRDTACLQASELGWCGMVAYCAAVLMQSAGTQLVASVKLGVLEMVLGVGTMMGVVVQLLGSEGEASVLCHGDLGDVCFEVRPGCIVICQEVT